MSRAKVVGVLGGMGPAATWDFCQTVLRLTPANTEQDHLRLLVDSDPGVPDRHAAMRGEGPSPAPHLVAMARGLVDAGADVLCMACNTAHMYADAIREGVSVPFIDMIESTVQAAVRAAPDAATVGLLATTTTVEAGLYQAAFARVDRTVLPLDAERQAAVMDLIFRVKAGHTGEDVRAIAREIAREPADAGANVIVAGCTEIPLVLNEEGCLVPFVSSTEALAQDVVNFAFSSRG